jgi:hypothetical protein
MKANETYTQKKSLHKQYFKKIKNEGENFTALG